MPRSFFYGPEFVLSPRSPSYAALTWGPYYETLHPPSRVHFIVVWKVGPGWMAYAERLWQQRQGLRRAYEAAHGPDPARWPSQHPGVVLGPDVIRGDYAACLGCHWLFARGYYGHDHVFQYPVDLALRHEASNGAFRGGEDDRLMPTARPTPSPAPLHTPEIPRRCDPAAPLLIADRYADGPRVARVGRRRNGDSR